LEPRGLLCEIDVKGRTRKERRQNQRDLTKDHWTLSIRVTQLPPAASHSTQETVSGLPRCEGS
jgi:hypothetical protein